MDLRTLEYAANVVFAMCREHPEIYPHDWHWTSARKTGENGMNEVDYRCSLCGQEKVEMRKDGCY